MANHLMRPPNNSKDMNIGARISTILHRLTSTKSRHLPGGTAKAAVKVLPGIFSPRR